MGCNRHTCLPSIFDCSVSSVNYYRRAIKIIIKVWLCSQWLIAIFVRYSSEYLYVYVIFNIPYIHSFLIALPLLDITAYSSVTNHKQNMCNKKVLFHIRTHQAVTNKIVILNLICAEIKVDVLIISKSLNMNENNIEHYKIMFSALSLTTI